MKVTTYNLKAVNGKPARIATMVMLDDGREIRFTDRMTKKQALRQVEIAQELGHIESLAKWSGWWAEVQETR